MNPEVLDQDAVNLAKAIRQTESGGNFTARGKSGEFGAYQYTKPTWEAYSKKYGINVNLEQATKEQQNEVTYRQIKEWKDSGYNPAQIASMWNSGKPDAYKDPQYRGVNQYGVPYDVPKYVDSVKQAYLAIKSGQDVGIDPQNPSAIGTQYQPPEEKKPFLRKAAEFLFPVLEKKERTPLQWAGDIGLSALTLLPGLGEFGLLGKGARAAKLATGAAKLAEGEKILEGGSLLSKALTSTVGKGAALGYGADVGTKLSEGKTDVGEILTPGAGTAIGGALGVGGKILQKASELLPEWIVKRFIPTKSEDVAKYALTKKLGNPRKMLVESEKMIDELGTKLGKVLKNPAKQYVQPSSLEIVNNVVKKFPNAALSPQEIAENLKKIAPLQKGLIDKFLSGADLTLTELHTLNSAIGKATFKSVFDEPAMKAGKEIGNALYQEISSILKTAVPESVPLFDQLSLEYALNKALEKASKKPAFSLGLMELMGLMGAGVPGAVGVGMLRSPTINLKTAGLIKGLSTSKLSTSVGAGLIAPTVHGLQQ